MASEMAAKWISQECPTDLVEVLAMVTAGLAVAAVTAQVIGMGDDELSDCLQCAMVDRDKRFTITSMGPLEDN